MLNLGVIILAAGGSTRMGQPKQLLKVNGKSLIRKTAVNAIAIASGPSLVVLGNAFEQIQAEIANLNLTIVENKDWEKGMAGSLRIGIKQLVELAPDLEAVLILLCDQPLITNAYLEKLYLEFKHCGKSAIASAYNEIKGVPAIFDFKVLKEFSAAEGDFGARHLIKQLDKSSDLAVLSFPKGAIDLDTPEDYEAFLKKNANSRN